MRDTTAGSTLKEELGDILLAHGNRWMTVRELADAVNQRGKYSKKDKEDLTPYEVHVYARYYPMIFERGGSSLRLSNPSIR
jgi:hypothetical protein